MRQMSLAAAAAISIFVMYGQGGAQGLSITNYQYVSQKPVTATKWDFTYKADLVNTGPALGSVTATLTSLDPTSFTVEPGKDTLTFGPVPANGRVTSSNTFTILVNRSVPFDNTFSKLSWTFQTTNVPPPVANAGPNQTVKVGSTVTLNGSGSTNPSGVGTLTYNWAFTSRPTGSAATLMNPTSVMPTFIVDVGGTYVLSLTVSNGQATSAPSTVTVSTGPVKPTANAGPNQTVNVGSTVHLDGSKSSDPNGNPLTYSWTLTSVPAGSTAVLSGANTVTPTFVADKVGSYTAQLIVNNGFQNSDPATVTITTQAVKPVAVPTATPQNPTVGQTVQLNGSNSTDANGFPLTYKWSLITLPAGSHATLSNATIVNPTFTVDVPGTYVAQLIVNNGFLDSDAATITVSTNAILAPTANAGPDQTVGFNSVVQLNGSASSDPQNLPLTYQWSLITKPAGSNATLSSATIVNPTFMADKTGTYVAQLIVNNGFLSSNPDTVMITTTCVKPTANPGPSQNVTVGATVQLNGSASSDPCSDTLTYSWTLLTKPAGSTATLSNATIVNPTFVADVAGDYVAQLIVNNGFQASDPATVTIHATPQTVITLSPSPLSIATGTTGTVTVTLSAAAGASGQLVNLSSSNTGAATVPASVTVAATQTTATVTVTPVATGSTTITASASGLVSGTATVNVVAPLVITTESPLPNGIQNSAYSATVAATGGTGSYTWSATGLPGNLTIDPSTGVISGTPTTAGTFNNVVVTVKDQGTPTPQSVNKTFSLTIAPILTITTTSPLKNGIQNSAYNTTVAASGGTGSFTWTATGLPAGLTINATTGVISGTPTASGTFNNVVVTVTDQGTPTHQSVNKTFSLTIAPQLTITTASLPDGTQNSAYPNTTVTASGGTGNFTWSATGLPTGVTINSSTGLISGTPTVSGPFNVVVTVTDQGTPTAQTASKTFPITIAPPVVTGIPVTISPVSVGQKLQTTTTISIGSAQATDLTFRLTSSNPSIALLNGSLNGGPVSVQQAIDVTIAAGFTRVNVAVIGVAVGNTTLVASGAATGSGAVTVTPSGFTLTGPGGSTVNLNQGASTNLQVSLVQLDTNGNTLSTTESLAPGNTATVTFTNTSPSVGSISPSPVTFQAGDTAKLVAFTAASTGSMTQATTTITANAPATFSAPAGNANQVTAFVAPVSCMVPAVAVGRNLETNTASDTSGVHVSLAGSPSADLNVTVSSNDTSRFLLSAAKTGPAMSQITVKVPAGQSRSADFFVVGQGTGALGTATPGYTANAGSFGSCSNMLTLNPSGFVFSAEGQPPLPNFSIGQNRTAVLTIVPAMLDSSLAFSAVQGIAPGLSNVTVGITSDKPDVGNVSPASVVFNGGDISAQTTFTSSATGSGVVTLQLTKPSTPVGFDNPSNDASVKITVAANTISVCGDPGSAGPVAVGYHLETSCFVSLSQVTGSTLTVTLTSNSPSLLLSTDPTVIGQQSIQVTIPAGTNQSNPYYLQGNACPVDPNNPNQPMCAGTSSVSTTYTATTTGFSDFGAVNITPSGLEFEFGGFFFFASVSGGPVQHRLLLYQRDPNSNARGANQALAPLPGSTSLPTSLHSSNPTVGTVTSPTFMPGDQAANYTFTPLAPGTTTLSADTPPNFVSTGTAQTITVNVSQ